MKQQTNTRTQKKTHTHNQILNNTTQTNKLYIKPPTKYNTTARKQQQQNISPLTQKLKHNTYKQHKHKHTRMKQTSPTKITTTNTNNKHDKTDKQKKHKNKHTQQQQQNKKSTK